MRTRRLAALVVMLAVLAGLGACGDDDDDAASSGDDDSTEVTSASDDDDSGDDVAAGSVDCAGIEESQQLLIGVQLLAQLRQQSQADAMRSGSPPFDPDAFIAAMESMRPLVAYAEPPFEDVEESIDIYIRAGEAAKAILDGTGPVAQADFDALAEITGPPEEVGAFLGHQASIGTAYDAACE